MGAPGSDPPVEEREIQKKEEGEEREGKGNKEEEKEEEEGKVRDVEKGEMGYAESVEEKVVVEKNDNNIHGDQRGFNASMLRTLNPTNPLRIAINGGRTRVAAPTRVAASRFATPSQPRSTPTPTSQISLTTLNSRRYTNKTSLFIFVLHMVAAVALVGFLVFKGIQGLLVASDSTKRKEKRVLQYFLPQVEAASLLSITLAFAWQKAVTVWPQFMVHFILWSSFFMSLSVGILLICFQKPPTDGVGVCFIAFAIGNGLYACWVNQRIGFCTKILMKSLQPVSKFPDLNQPTYWMLGAGFTWMSLWILAVVGALNFYVPPLIIIALVLSLAWTTEVMRNVVNLTVSRVIALYYLRGMQPSTQFCFQRALTKNLGSACLGSLFVPAIEALRIVARGLNVLEGEDEFMFSCAHCCLRVMESIFRYGNGWAYVQVAAYGKGFVKASQDTWGLFERQEMECIVDSDMTSALCFLTGVCSGSICVIVVAAWTAKVHLPFTATVSLLAFFVGYLMCENFDVSDPDCNGIASCLCELLLCLLCRKPREQIVRFNHQGSSLLDQSQS
ncbi:protein PNS1 isoform X2 [Mangifera indica]|uniref:protein PNS1 isoform X2 n=1 Tax=Mangifera indica TaxID=29780 RepID=UPI001CFB608A|nr:protein PNS1 isoform X2 [Mangifera indica]